MPFVTPSVRRRILITGETGSGKTHALRSFPGPKYVMLFPGEKGHGTLMNANGSGEPLDADTVVRWWENPDSKSGEPPLSTQVIEEVRKETIASLKIPNLQTWCGDGLHKLYEYVIDAKSGGEYFAGSPFKTESRLDTQVVDPRVAGQAEHWISDYISLISLSRIPYVVFTAWDTDKGMRKAKILEPAVGSTPAKKEKWTDIPTAKMPALYSAASRRVLGEFNYCVHASVSRKRMPREGGKMEWQSVYQWQTQPDDMVGACAIKGDAVMTAKFPKFIPADWRELAKYVEGDDGH